jgi:MFS family permease
LGTGRYRKGNGLSSEPHLRQQEEPPAANRPQDRPGKGLLLVVLAGIFLVQADLFAFLVSMPAMHRELGLAGGALQFLMAGFSIANASLLITAGRLGDLLGARRMYLLGLGLFSLTTLFTAFASDLATLLLARTMQGATAALIQPQVLGILARSFQGEASRRAFAAYAFTMGLGSIAGQLLGGFVISIDVFSLGWRAVFLLLAPLALGCLLVGWRKVPRHDAAHAQSLDWAGVALSILLLTLITAPLTIGQSVWPLGVNLALLGAAPMVAYLFLRHQLSLQRAGRSQMLPIRLLVRRSTRLALLAVFCFFCGVASFHVLQTLYLQQVQGASALQTGLIFSSMALSFMGGSAAAPALARRLGARAIVLGAVVLALSHGWNLYSARSGLGLAGLGAAIVAAGLGMGLLMGPLISRVLARVPPLDAGALSGLVATLQAAANAIGVAVVPLPFMAAATLAADERSAGYVASMGLLIGLALTVAFLASVRRRD